MCVLQRLLFDTFKSVATCILTCAYCIPLKVLLLGPQPILARELGPYFWTMLRVLELSQELLTATTMQLALMTVAMQKMLE